MRILAVSDYIDDLSCGAAVDLILSCGDLPPEHLSSLARGYGVPLYYVRGNHDIRPDFAPGAGCLDIHARAVRLGDLTILGLEGSHWYNGGPRQYTEAQVRRLLRQLRPRLRRAGGPDIVVAHAAPQGVRDGEDPCHRGFASYRRLIERYQPRYFLHGHIHRPFAAAAERVTQVGRTRVVNCSGCYLFEVDDEEFAR